MPLCPAPTCPKFFKTLKGLNIHFVRSPTCSQWAKDTGRALPRYAPDDPESWPSLQEEPFGDNHNFLDDYQPEVEEDSFTMNDVDILDANINPPPHTNQDETLQQRYYYYPYSDQHRTFEKKPTPYSITQASEKDPMNIAYPFADMDEWSLAKWLCSTGLPNQQIAAFLQLDWVQKRGNFSPSFSSAKDLINRIEHLPSVPSWKAVWVSLPEAPDDPQLLLYRDSLECLAWLESNPEFSSEKDYIPYEEYLDEARSERCYSEVASGTMWNDIQAQYPEDITIHPYILTSDSTHLTNFSGDKKVKPLLITSAHIRQSTRAAPSRRAFLCIAFLPEGKFPNLEFKNATQAKEMPGILRNRLYHESMSIVLEPLRRHESDPVKMVDSEGFERYEILRLIGYISDLPEQTLIATVAANECVCCEVRPAELGSNMISKPRTSQSILDRIKSIRDQNPHADTWKFVQEAKQSGLSGVEHPWWASFTKLDICKVICPDVLHGLHKAFKDHLATWNVNLIGKLELDARLTRMPKWPGFRHFTAGISKISQWSGKEHRDLQRYFLTAISGHAAIPRDVIRATRAELDFIYTAQYHSHTEQTLMQLSTYNDLFHSYKNIFIATGARRGKNGIINHFNIPKLHTRLHYPDFIRQIGATGNFCTETSERYHIEYAKKAYKSVSRNGYALQMVRWLDRQEKIRYFDRYLKWRLNISNNDLEVVDEPPDDESMDPDEHVSLRSIPVPVHLYEPNLSKRPRWSKLSLNQALSSGFFNIEHSTFEAAVLRYEATLIYGDGAVGRGWTYMVDELPDEYRSLDVWSLFRIKLPVLDELHDQVEMSILRAPRYADDGVGDVVFIDTDPDAETMQVGIKGFVVGQLRMIFRPAFSSTINPNIKAPHLAFVEWFTVQHLDPNMNMYTVVKTYNEDGSRRCDIIRLDSVVQRCPLIPKFLGPAAGLDDEKGRVNGYNCIERVDEFWINSFHSKSTYQSVF